MTWPAVFALAVGSVGLRLTGMFAIEPALERWPILRRVADVLPAAVVAAVVAQLSFVSAGTITIDARAAGIATAVVLVWRRAPLIVVVIAAAATTAAVRAVL